MVEILQMKSPNMGLYYVSIHSSIHDPIARLSLEWPQSWIVELINKLEVGTYHMEDLIMIGQG